MAGKVMAGSFLGAIVLFAWGAASWMFLPFHNMTTHEFPQEEGLRQLIRTGSTRPTAVYWFPRPPHGPQAGTPVDAAAQQEWERKWQEGPIGLLIVRKGGLEPMPVSAFVFGFGIQLGGALLASVFLAAAATSLPRYGMRVAFVSLLGLFAGVVVHLPYWNWMTFPADFTLVQIVDTFFGYVLAGFVIGAVVRPRRPAPAPVATPRP